MKKKKKKKNQTYGKLWFVFVYFPNPPQVKYVHQNHLFIIIIFLRDRIWITLAIANMWEFV